MTKRFPLVSVLMSVYNGEEYLRGAVDSILNQTFKDFEFIIVDDASTDKTASILKCYKDLRIKIITNPKNLGLSASLNKGIQRTKGEYIVRMDVDDISLPERFEKQVNYLDVHPYCDVVVAKIQLIDIGGNLIGKWEDDQNNTTYNQINNLLPVNNCLAHPTVMIRSSIIKKYKYNERIFHSSDYELWFRLCSDGKRIEKINEELVYYRVRPDSVTARSLRRGASYKNIQTKSQFLLGRINQFKIGYFEIKTTFYLLNDIFFFVYLNFRKNIFYYLKKVLINIGKTIGNLTSSKYSSDVFFFFPFYHTGGAEKVHADIVNCIKTERQPLIVFTNKSDNSNFKYLFEGKGHILDLSTLPFKNLLQYIWLGILASRINKCQHAVTFGCNSTLYYEVLKYLRPQVKKIDLIHAFGGGIEYVSLPFVDKIDRRVVVNSKTQNDLRHLYKSLGLNEKLNNKIITIENKVTIPKILPKKRHINKFNFIYVGRWSEEKRVYLILEVAKLCFEKKIPANFTIIGEIPSSVKNQYGKYCFFTGEVKSVDKMNKYYKKADFILITSMREGFPLVIMEAMAYGVIPISTNVGNIPFHIKSWQNGIIIEDKTEPDIVARILEIISKVNKNHSLVEKMSFNAYQYMAKHFGSESFCQKYNQLIQKNAQ